VFVCAVQCPVWRPGTVDLQYTESLDVYNKPKHTVALKHNLYSAG